MKLSGGGLKTPLPSPMERYRAAVEANDFSVFVFWRGLW